MASSIFRNQPFCYLCPYWLFLVSDNKEEAKMVEKRKSLISGETRLVKKGQLLIEQAEIIANGIDLVKIMAASIEYDRLLARLYRKNLRVR